MTETVNSGLHPAGVQIEHRNILHLTSLSSKFLSTSIIQHLGEKCVATFSLARVPLKSG